MATFRQAYMEVTGPAETGSPKNKILRDVK
jgi:hypothetical protein